MHGYGAQAIASAAKAAGAHTLLHISGLGAEAASTNAYIASKGQGEQATREAFPDAIVLRPSVVFGPEDQFFNRFANLARFMPVVAGVRRRGPRSFNRCYVADIAVAAAKAIDGGLQAGDDLRAWRPRER